jgi:flavorubredoxin
MSVNSRIDEIADGIYRISTLVPEIAAPTGLTFNSFLIRAQEPLLFHTGLRRHFPLISAAVARVLPVEDLRWISFGHYEADECGAMNEWLAAAPAATVAHGRVGTKVSLDDMADRPPRALDDGEVIDLGGKRVRYIDTNHVPHGWDAGVILELTTNTLLCSDLFTHIGDPHALTNSDVVGPAIEAENLFQFSSLNPAMGPTLRRLAALTPTTLAIMHGSSFSGDGAAALTALSNFYDQRLRTALTVASNAQ